MDEMGDKVLTNTYRVYMQTPLGERTGILLVEQNGNALKGWLDILKHREPLEGSIDELGNCRISSVFITLMRRVPYVATGQISASAVHLKIEEGRNVFEVSGVPCLESREEIN